MSAEKTTYFLDHDGLAGKIQRDSSWAKFFSTIGDIVTLVCLIIGKLSLPYVNFIAAFSFFGARIADVFKRKKKTATINLLNLLIKEEGNQLTNILLKVNGETITSLTVNTSIEVNINTLQENDNTNQSTQAGWIYFLIATGILFQILVVVSEGFITWSTAPQALQWTALGVNIVAIIFSQIAAYLEEKHYDPIEKKLRWVAQVLQVLVSLKDHQNKTSQQNYLNALLHHQAQRNKKKDAATVTASSIKGSSVGNTAPPPAVDLTVKNLSEAALPHMEIKEHKQKPNNESTEESKATMAGTPEARSSPAPTANLAPIGHNQGGTYGNVLRTSILLPKDTSLCNTPAPPLPSMTAIPSSYTTLPSHISFSPLVATAASLNPAAESTPTDNKPAISTETTFYSCQ